MSGLPLQVRLLLASLSGAALLPFVLLLAEFSGLVAPGLGWLVDAGSVLLALCAFALFEPPRSASPFAWLRQIRRRIDAVPSSNPPTNPEV